jgi:hypothetical protein
MNTYPFDYSKIPTSQLEVDLETTKYYLEAPINEAREYYQVGNCPEEILHQSLKEEIADLEKELNARRS